MEEYDMEQVISPQDHIMERPIMLDAFDPFYSHFRMAESLPHWLQLQQQIREHLNRLMARRESVSLELTQSDITLLNELITAYNESIPNIHLRKAFITVDDVEEAFESWQ
jgi:hypothetical protein